MPDPQTAIEVITAGLAGLAAVLTGFAAVLGAATAVVSAGRKLAEAIRRFRQPRPDAPRVDRGRDIRTGRGGNP